MSSLIASGVPLSAALLIALAGSPAHAQTLPTVVYCNLTSAPASTTTINVPTRGDQTFSSAPFDGLHRSPNGQRFILIANTNDVSASNRIIIAGTTSPATGSVIVRKGESIPNYTTRTINILDNARINDAGQFVFNTNTGGSGTLSLFFFFGSTVPTLSYGYVAASTEAVPGHPGWTFSGGYNATLIDNAGHWGFQTGINTGAGAQPTVWFNGQVIAQANDPATAPTMLPGSTPTNWGSFTLRRVFVDAGGSSFVWIGTPPSASNDTCAINNTAVAEEGAAFPANGLTVGFVSSCWQDPSGAPTPAWYLRGEFGTTTLNTANTDFVIRNGAIVAKRGDPIVPASAITWDRASTTSTSNGFLMNAGNAAGHYFIAGNTLEGAVRSSAGVIDGTSIVIRKGDPVDVNGNGLADDDAFVQGFNSEVGAGKAFLTDSGQLWLDINIQNGANVSIGRAIVRMQVAITPPCAPDFNHSGGLEVQDIFDFLNAWFAGNPAADFNGGGLAVQDIFDFLNAWFAGC
jgi:hypothetical protein